MNGLILFILFSSFSLGELARFEFANGIAISALDVISAIIVLVIIGRGVCTKKVVTATLTVPIAIFSCIGLLSLLVNIANFPLQQIVISSLYLIRWVTYTGVYFFILQLPLPLKKRLPQYFLASGSMIVLLGFMQYFLYPNLSNLYYAGWDTHYLRLFSTFLDPNFTGILLVLFFLFSLHLFMQSLVDKNKGIAIALGCSIFVTFCAIFLTYSRGAFIALGAGTVAYIAVTHAKKLFWVVGSMIILFTFFVIFLTNMPTEGAHLFRTASSTARITAAARAITIFSEHPLLGVGFNTYRYAQNKKGYLAQNSWESSHAAAGADNSFLFLLATIGIIGLLSYIYLLYKIFQVIKVSTTGNSFGSLGSASLIALLVNCLFINSAFFPAVMVWMWALIGFIESM